MDRHAMGFFLRGVGGRGGFFIMLFYNTDYRKDHTYYRAWPSRFFF